MGIQAMKVHQSLTRGFPSSFPLDDAHLRPLAPKLIPTFDIKNFIIPDQSAPRKIGSSDNFQNKESADQPSAGGGTRWNPTHEQIALLETLYRRGMRTPNAQQIEQITAQLSNYGKIEGKNVFYWFQNHKARERQKLKRNSIGTSRSPRTPLSSNSLTEEATSLLLSTDKEGKDDNRPYKKQCTSWTSYEEDSCIDGADEEDGQENRTLKLFPLHPGK